MNGGGVFKAGLVGGAAMEARFQEERRIKQVETRIFSTSVVIARRARIPPPL